MLDLLTTEADIEIVHLEPDVYGNNPLNPTRIVG